LALAQSRDIRLPRTAWAAVGDACYPVRNRGNRPPLPVCLHGRWRAVRVPRPCSAGLSARDAGRRRCRESHQTGAV